MTAARLDQSPARVAIRDLYAAGTENVDGSLTLPWGALYGWSLQVDPSHQDLRDRRWERQAVRQQAAVAEKRAADAEQDVAFWRAFAGVLVLLVAVLGRAWGRR